MNAQFAALLAATALFFGPADANSARADDAPLRKTGVGREIGQQGNDALHRIRIELATTLHQRIELPELAARVDHAAAHASEDIALAASGEPSLARPE